MTESPMSQFNTSVLLTSKGAPGKSLSSYLVGLLGSLRLSKPRAPGIGNVHVRVTEDVDRRSHGLDLPLTYFDICRSLGRKCKGATSSDATAEDF